MKELSIEDKAKRYDDASKWMEGIYPTLTHEQQMEAEAFFPTIKESEDEKIRKALISVLKSDFENDTTIHDISVGDIIAWLEKQCEQKPAWSEEDERKMDKIYSILGQAADTHAYSTTCRLIGDKESIELQDFLKFLKDRVQPQPKQEWSEEDESYLNTTIAFLKDAKEFKKTAENCINWLKSLKPQSTWKPSDEQLRELRCVISGCSFETPILVQLEEDLKKLL